MTSVDEAAAKTARSALSIYRDIEAGKIHYAETEEGTLLVCLNSCLA